MTEKKNVKTEIIEEAKKEGLDIAEDAIAAIWKAVIRVLARYAANSPNIYVKMIAPIIGVLEAPVLSLIDKIDGEDDGR